VLSLAGPLISNILGTAELAKSIDSSLGVSGLALFLTTVISTAGNHIALFHAICIFHLLALAGLSVKPKGRYPMGRIRFWAFNTFYVVAVTGSLSYFIYVFTTAPTFGNQPQCNDQTLYVIFGFNITATNNVIRWIFVASFAVLLLGFGMYLLLMMGAVCSLALGCTSCCGITQQDSELPSDEAADGPKRRIPYHLIGHVVACAYIIAMLELIIARNNLGPGARLWTFGQVLAMMMLIGPIIELLSLLLGSLDQGPEA
jgi:hypothetical protein